MQINTQSIVTTTNATQQASATASTESAANLASASTGSFEVLRGTNAGLLGTAPAPTSGTQTSATPMIGVGEAAGAIAGALLGAAHYIVGELRTKLGM